MNCLKRLDTKAYASGSDDCKVILWSSTGALIKNLTAHSDSVLCLELLGNGLLASGGADSNIFIWNYTSSSTTYTVALTNAHGDGKMVSCIKQLTDYYFASAAYGKSNNLKVFIYKYLLCLFMEVFKVFIQNS